MATTPVSDGPVIPGLTAEVYELLFEGAPAELQVNPITWWAAGPVVQVPTGSTELMGFAFGPKRYIALFSEPLASAGGDVNFIQMVARNVADSYPIDPENARLVKFCRADANDKLLLFDPEPWKLPEASDVFEFTHVLAEVMSRHFLQVAPTQYFFQPSTAALGILYRRVFRVIDRELLQSTFRRINEPTGTYVGYERIPPN
jgi:hypothetical protein